MYERYAVSIRFLTTPIETHDPAKCAAKINKICVGTVLYRSLLFICSGISVELFRDFCRLPDGLRVFSVHRKCTQELKYYLLFYRLSRSLAV